MSHLLHDQFMIVFFIMFSLALHHFSMLISNKLSILENGQMICGC